MSEPEPPRLAGTHRRRGRSRLNALLGSLLVAVLAAVGVLAALNWRGESSRPQHPVAGSSASSHPASTSKAASPPVGSTSGSTSGSAGASAGVSAGGSASATTPPPTTAAPSAASTSAGPLVRPPVDVLNDSRISGMAARAKATLTAAGWTVAKTDNYAHVIQVTTVYYPAGQRAAAQLLAGQFAKIRQVEPAPAGLSTSHLTLVLTHDWE